MFDPACSTGTFLSSPADAVPRARCLGADLSPATVRRAAARSANVVVADAAHPPLPPGSVDLLVVRFLNAEVVPRATAGPLFTALARLVAPRGTSSSSVTPRSCSPRGPLPARPACAW
ncbi:class I SAM-dependent methyltransferase [Umezawaea beigongshangensis]|uniref:class I SAM-dependent methyltransferase n=1 Tax=Umezawaea beigongshangensis TaxID=2780383 RepID=UPI0018F1BBEB|nr:class I SAM-dependent methyltransferase [Umezawaea beigongshangensis]